MDKVVDPEEDLEVEEVDKVVDPEEDLEVEEVDQDHKVDLHLVNSTQEEEIGGQRGLTNQYTFLLTILEWF